MIGFNQPYTKAFAKQLMYIYPSTRAFESVRAALFDVKAPIDYYYPPMSLCESSEVPGEVILIKTSTEMKYYEECMRFICEQFLVPTEEEISIAENIILKNCNDLSEEEAAIYEKFKSRFYKNAIDSSDKCYFDEEPVTLINPFVRGFEVIMKHYFDHYTVNRIMKIITDFIEPYIPNPDMKDETYDVVVAVAHWIRACLIKDYEYLVNKVNKDYYKYGKIDYYEYEKKDSELEEIVMRHSKYTVLDLKFDNDGEVKSNSSYPGRYWFYLITDKFKGHKILPNSLPHHIEELILDTMVKNNKYGFTINASRYFDIWDFECHRLYRITDSLKTTFNNYREHYLGDCLEYSETTKENK